MNVIRNGIATEYLGLTDDGAVFRTAYHPDRLDGMCVDLAGVMSIYKNWDRCSNIKQHFDSGETLFIPANLVSRLCADVLLRSS